MIIRVYLFVPRWRPVIGRFLVLWHSFNKFVLAKRLHEPAVFNRNHIFFFIEFLPFFCFCFAKGQLDVSNLLSCHIYIYIHTYLPYLSQSFPFSVPLSWVFVFCVLHWGLLA